MKGRKYRTRMKHKRRPSKTLQVQGTLECHPQGYGFVRPDHDSTPDVYVSERNMHDAMHKDQVLAKVIKRKPDGRLEGKITRVLERGTSDLVGLFNGSLVIPRDERHRMAIWIEPEERAGATRGDMVMARITRYPKGMSGPGGKIIKVLGREQDPEIESKAVLVEHGFAEEFPKEVKDIAKNGPSNVKKQEIRGRRDLRENLFVTIDPPDARDFDDAVAVRKTDAGYTLWVSIADVSHYVTPVSAVDQEAYNRATSVYLPDRAVPMLPEELSSGICSLKPRTTRLAMTAEMRFDMKGKRKGFRFYEAVIRSRFRLNYDEVRRIVVDKDRGLRKKYSGAIKSLETMRELAELMIEQRRRRGAIDLDLPEAGVIFDEQGILENIVLKERNIAHRIIEEFMLAANEAVAGFMAEGPGPFVYRIHEPPSPEAVSALDEFLGGLGIRLLGKRQSPEDIQPVNYQRVLATSEGKPFQAAVHMLCLRSMMLARYDTKNLGHFGLASEKYCHFTSPIRRYPDLMVHRLLKSRLGIKDQKGPPAPDDINRAAEHCSERERAAEHAERDMMKYYAAELMAEKIGEKFKGTVSGVTKFGVFVQLDDPFVEGMIPAESISRYKARQGDIIFDEKKHTLSSRSHNLSLSLGDRLLVEVEEVNRDIKHVNLRFIQKLKKST
jgi:ribonuclease R